MELKEFYKIFCTLDALSHFVLLAMKFDYTQIDKAIKLRKSRCGYKFIMKDGSIINV